MRCTSVWRSLRSLVAVACGLGLAAFQAAPAVAALEWYDGFELTGAGGTYTSGAALGGQSGGAGTFFTGPWVQASGDDHLVQATSLSRPGLTIAPLGGAVGDNDTPMSCCITSRDGLTFSTPWGGFTDPDATYYFGFLANFGKGPTMHHRVVEMWDGGLADSQRNLQLGYSEFTGTGSGGLMGLKVYDSTTMTNTDVNLAENVNFTTDNGTTHYMVLKFAMSTTGNDVVSVFLDPVGAVEPAPSAQVSVGQFLVDRFGGITNFVFGDATSPSWDELRVGTTFADVQINTLPYSVPVPEPGAVVLAGLSLMGLVGARRMR